MYLYNSYCYSDIQSVIDSVKSRLFFDGFGFIQSVTQTAANSLTIVYLDNTGKKTNSVVVSVPACTRSGFDNSYTGLTFDDAVQLSSLVVVVLATAYAFKLLKKAF